MVLSWRSGRSTAHVRPHITRSCLLQTIGEGRPEPQAGEVSRRQATVTVSSSRVSSTEWEKGLTFLGPRRVTGRSWQSFVSGYGGVEYRA